MNRVDVEIKQSSDVKRKKYYLLYFYNNKAHREDGPAQQADSGFEGWCWAGIYLRQGGNCRNDMPGKIISHVTPSKKGETIY